MGGKKHKKKIYTKPRKIKHKHKKVKLGVLEFYNVDDSGNFKDFKLKAMEGPNAECGVGTFMDDHFDRIHCGKCGLTYKKANNA